MAGHVDAGTDVRVMMQSYAWWFVVRKGGVVPVQVRLVEIFTAGLKMVVRLVEDCDACYGERLTLLLLNVSSVGCALLG